LGTTKTQSLIGITVDRITTVVEIIMVIIIVTVGTIDVGETGIEVGEIGIEETTTETIMLVGNIIKTFNNHGIICM